MTRSYFLPGDAKKLATNNYTDGVDSKHDEVTVAGLPFGATYSVSLFGISTATISSHILQIMAGASLNVYVWYVELTQGTAATTAGFVQWVVKRLSTAGTGGGVLTPLQHDTSDAASGATAMTLPTVKGTEVTNLFGQNKYFVQTPGAAGVSPPPVFLFDARGGAFKPWRIAAGATNGIAIKNNTAMAGATVDGTLILQELAY